MPEKNHCRFCGLPIVSNVYDYCQLGQWLEKQASLKAKFFLMDQGYFNNKNILQFKGS